MPLSDGVELPPPRPWAKRRACLGILHRSNHCRRHDDLELGVCINYFLFDSPAATHVARPCCRTQRSVASSSCAIDHNPPRSDIMEATSKMTTSWPLRSRRRSARRLILSRDDNVPTPTAPLRRSSSWPKARLGILRRSNPCLSWHDDLGQGVSSCINFY